MVTEKPISDEELDAIQARVEATTMWTPDECEITTTEWEECPFYAGQGATIGDTFIQLADTGDNSTEDWLFVAHARTDVPKLLAEINRLKAKLEETNNLLNDEMGIG
jgi:hypothetical protein